LEHEVIGKTIGVSFDGLVEGLGRRLVQVGQVTIEHDLAAADKVDPPLDQLDWDGGRRTCADKAVAVPPA
jgi:hypothetical protein